MNAEHRRERPAEQFLILGMSPRTILAAGLTLVGTAATAITLIIGAVHDAAQQVRDIRDEFQRNPPTTGADIDQLETRIRDTTRTLRQDVTDSIDHIDTTPNVVVEQPPERPQRPPQPPATPAATPRPTPSPTPSPRLLPPLPPLFP